MKMKTKLLYKILESPEIGIGCFLTLRQTTLKEFADDTFEFGENDRKI